MKLIKRLIIALIPLFLLASCNVASSSIVSTPGATSTSSSVSTTSVSGLTSIVLSSTSSATQFVGLTSRVLVTATIDVASSNISLDWFLDGVLSTTQKGLVFEFMPVGAKDYEVYAKVGNITSNIFKMKVDTPSFNIASFNIVNANTLQLAGESGLTFNITGLSLGTSSSYNIVNKTYTLSFLSPMIQGTNYNLVINKVGFKELVYPFVYETRKIEVGYVLYNEARIVINSAGVYELTRPFSGSDLTYTVSIAHTNLEGANTPVSFLTTAPADATAIAAYQTTINLQKGINVNHFYTLTPTSKLGLYTHNVTIGGLNLIVRINVKAPTPEIKLGTAIVFDIATPSGGGYTPMATPFAKDADDEYIKKTVKPQTDGSYLIFRPYNGLAYELTFNILANNFETPAGFPAQGNPYNFLTALSGPTGSLMLYSNTSNTIVNQFPFRETIGSNYRISLFVDNKTNSGTYNLIFSVASAVGTITRTITFIVREYAPVITPVITYNDQEVKANTDGSFTIFKPLETNQLAGKIELKVENYESPLQSATSPGVGFNTLYLSTGSTYRYLLNYSVSYQGPLAGVVASSSKIALELGQNTNVDGANVDSVEATPLSYKRFKSTTASELIDVSLINDATNYDGTTIFASMLTLTSASFPGTHIYNVTIGTLTRQLVFRIEEARPSVIVREDSIKYGPSSSNVSADNVTFNELDGKYYVNGKNGYLDVDIFPFGMISGNYPYTFTRRSPSGSFQSTTNTVALTLRVNVGSPGSYTERYDGTLKFPQSGAGSEMKFNIKLSEEGEYVYTYVINGQSRQISVVVLPSPELRVDSITYNDVSLVFNGNFYYLPHSTIERYLEITLIPFNLENDYKFVISENGAIPTAATKNDIAIVDGKVVTGINFPVTTGAESTIDFYIMLFKGNVRVGEVTKLVFKAQPSYFATYYDINGGTIANPITPSIQFFTGALTAPNPAPTRTNFDFGGWYSDPGFSTGTKIDFSTYTVPENNVVLYARWLTRYSITYDLNGGANPVGPPTNPTSFNIETNFVLLDAIKGGSTFAGWYLDAGLTQQITSIAPGRTDDLVIYAKWNP